MKIDYAGRLRQAQARLGEMGTDLMAIPPGDNLIYLLGFTPIPDERPCYLLVTPAAAAFLVPSLNAEQAKVHTTLPLFAYADADGPQAALAQAAAHLKLRSPRRLAAGETMRADHLLLLMETWGVARPALASDLIAPMRARKDPAEIEILHRSAATADAATEAAFRACRPGATELDVADAAASAFREAGAEEVCFTLIASGPNGAFPHHHTGARRLQAGDAVGIDLGGRLGHYSSDITRMAVLDDPSPRYQKVHATVEAAVQAAMAAAKPGVPARQVDRAARKVIEEAGFGEFFVHRTGHGLGLADHEPPYITGTNPEPLEVGVVFSIEPGIYLPGEFGVRLEEIVVMTERGAERFSALPREVRVIK
ncbi:MAG: aminopeptidase P family protein [Armatimonadetes bacterium]|nr:aminopeptidase P family protein [Armatimonadota bacterium]